jgi:hypothetical protein
MTKHNLDWVGGFFVGLGLGIMICTTVLGLQQRKQENEIKTVPSYVVPPDITVRCIASTKNPCARRGARIIGDGPTVEAAVRAVREDLKTIACE